MRLRLLAAVALGTAIVAAGPSGATVMRGSYAGTILSGNAVGAFGFAEPTDVAGQGISGTFSYDTEAFTGSCGGCQVWYRCYRTPGTLTITQSVNGVEEVFTSTPALPGAPSGNIGNGAVAHYTLAYEGLELGIRSLRGHPAIQSNLYHTHLGVIIPTGRAGADVAADGMPSYSGPAISGSGAPLGDLFIGSGSVASNQTVINTITAGFVTRNANFLFDMTEFAIGPAPVSAVPEPATWGLMIAGFALVGGALRRRREQAALSSR